MGGKQSTRIQSILEKEGITKTELSKESGVNLTTIHGLCKGLLISKGRVVETKAVTLHKIVNAINNLAKNSKYELADIFPDRVSN